MENAFTDHAVNMSNQIDIKKYRTLKLLYKLFCWFAAIAMALEFPFLLLYPSLEARINKQVDIAQSIASFSISALQSILITIATVFFFILVYRACKNLYAFGEERLKYSPGWSVGWFFIPFANLGMPYVVMAEIMKKSVSSTLSIDDRRKPSVVRVVLWWASFLAVYILLMWFISYGPKFIMSEGIESLDVLYIISIIFQVLLAILLLAHTIAAIFMLRQITMLQESKYNQIKSNILPEGTTS